MFSDMSITSYSSYVFTINNFFSEEQCKALITRSEQIGYNEATIVTDAGPRLVKTVRNNSRIIFIDEALAASLWPMVQPYIKKLGNSVPIGLNEMFRFYKYEPGQSFKKHTDESFIRNEQEASYYTLLIYLNDEFTGGDTRFNDVVIKPVAGQALVFLHGLEHSGSTVKSGTKYVLRTDVMFRLGNY